MRTKDVMHELEDITILLQWLYQDDDHEVRIENSVGFMRFKMDEDLNIMRFNENFPEIGWGYCELTVRELFSIKRQLEETTGDIMFPNKFKNKWEEIKRMTLSSLWLNKD